MTAPSALLSYASEFNDYSSSDILVKTAYIRKRKGRWFVLSEKGKSLGDYATKDEAVKRLRQVEYFKHHPKKKKASKEEGLTYSSIMRDLTKKGDEKLLKAFMETFKKSFDAAYIAGDEHPEKAALKDAKKVLEKEAAQMSVLVKRATDAINLGDPMTRRTATRFHCSFYARQDFSRPPPKSHPKPQTQGLFHQRVQSRLEKGSKLRCYWTSHNAHQDDAPLTSSKLHS